jgi:uncharacterized protein
MVATYLIDGYNLLHVMGLMAPRLGPHGLESARARLIGLIAGAMEKDAAAVTVVFDGTGGIGHAASEPSKRGIQILFSPGKQEADDVIERQILRSSAPKDLHVVSDDRRIRSAARRRHCHALGCEAFLKFLDRYRQQRRQQELQTPEKVENLSAEQTEAWIAEFGDLEKDPKLRRAFEPSDFEEMEP